MAEHMKPEDLRFATDQERRYALAYLRWLAGGDRRRATEPSPTHRTYAVSTERAAQIRDDVDQLVRDAASALAG
jgi:hypothetical protein